MPSASFPHPHPDFDYVPSKPRNQFARITNYIHKFPKHQHESDQWWQVYSPFICHIPDSWLGHNVSYSLFMFYLPSISLQQNFKGVVDYTQCVNESTLGPYSFKLFTDVAWTEENCKSSVLLGRRPKIQSGTGIKKRPKKQNIPSGKSRNTQRQQQIHMAVEEFLLTDNNEPATLEADIEIGPHPTSRSGRRRK